METSLRLREERLKRNEGIKKKVDDIKAKLDRKSPNVSSPVFNNNSLSSLTCFMTKYRRHIFVGLLTLITGSIFLYKVVKNNDRTY